MTVTEMWLKNPNRPSCGPNSLFRVKHPTKGIVVVCFAEVLMMQQTGDPLLHDLCRCEVIDEYISSEKYHKMNPGIGIRVPTSHVHLKKLSEMVAYKGDGPVEYSGPVPFQGLVRFHHNNPINRVLRTLSLRWILFREWLAPKVNLNRN
jgi:hypothetical protein